jgi:hypothetical protein
MAYMGWHCNACGKGAEKEYNKAKNCEKMVLEIMP